MRSLFHTQRYLPTLPPSFICTIPSLYFSIIYSSPFDFHFCATPLRNIPHIHLPLVLPRCFNLPGFVIRHFLLFCRGMHDFLHLHLRSFLFFFLHLCTLMISNHQSVGRVFPLGLTAVCHDSYIIFSRLLFPFLSPSYDVQYFRYHSTIFCVCFRPVPLLLILNLLFLFSTYVNLLILF